MNLRPTQASTFALIQNGLTSNFGKLVEAQEQVSSGKRILRPSDDPIGTLRALTLKTRVDASERYAEAIDGGKRSLDSAAAALESAGGLVGEARALVLQAINGVANAGDRDLIAGQLREIHAQLLDLANTRFAGRYLFAGTALDAPPFASADEQGLLRTSYVGNREQQELLVGDELRVAAGLPGSSIFAAVDPSGTSFEGLTGARSGSSPDQGQGVFALHVRHDSTTLNVPGLALVNGGLDDTLIGNHSITVDPVAGTITLDTGPARRIPAVGSADYDDFTLTNAAGDSIHLDFSGWGGGAVSGTAVGAGSMSIDGSNWTTIDGVSTDVQLIDAASGRVLHVDVTAIHRSGEEMVSFSGSVNLLDSLAAIVEALDSSAGLSTTEQVRRVNLVFEELDRNHDNLLAGLSTLGARSARLTSLDEEHDGQRTQLKGQISTIEDADYSKVILDMTRAEQTLQLTQSVGSRLLQTSLLDFLR